jgi:hypothetical protein
LRDSNICENFPELTFFLLFEATKRFWNALVLTANRKLKGKEWSIRTKSDRTERMRAKEGRPNLGPVESGSLFIIRVVDPFLQPIVNPVTFPQAAPRYLICHSSFAISLTHPLLNTFDIWISGDHKAQASQHSFIHDLVLR